MQDVIKYGSVVLHKVDGRASGSRFEGPRRRRFGAEAANQAHPHRDSHPERSLRARSSAHGCGSTRRSRRPTTGRLDITHFAHLSDEEIQKIEDVANDIVMKNLPVTITNLPRRVAEEKYGFRIFQGGVVPSRTLRIVNIADWDVQACGGTHVKTTGEVGFIKIVKTERIQDGVERLDFVAGYPAVTYVQEMDSTIGRTSSVLNTQRENIVKVSEEMKQKLEETSWRERSLGREDGRRVDPGGRLVRQGGQGRKGLSLQRKRDERRTDC